MIVSDLDVFLHASKDSPDCRLRDYVSDHRLMNAVVHLVSVSAQLLNESVYFGIFPVLDGDSSHCALLQYAFVLLYEFVSFHALSDCADVVYSCDAVLDLGYFIHRHVEIYTFHAGCYGSREELVAFALSACRGIEGDASARLVQA